MVILRTGSFGNRDAETLIKTLPEPKRSILSELRSALLSVGYSEETGYDPISIESFISYSSYGTNRLIFKHKWEVAVFLVLIKETEKASLLAEFPNMKKKVFERNTDDGTIWVKLDPKLEKETILRLSKVFSPNKLL